MAIDNKMQLAHGFRYLCNEFINLETKEKL